MSLLLLLAGCSGEAPHAGVLVAALSSDPAHLNPAITTQGGLHTAASLLYDGLVALDEEVRPVPALAERWSIEDGGRRYRFHLRRGVRWHDGQPFTAADVKFTFDSVLLRFHARTRASMGAALAAIEAPDDSTVVFQFHQPYAVLLQQLNMVEAPILPQHRYANTDPISNPTNRAPVGTGPFRFVSYRPDVEIQYEANPDYFGGKPAIDRIVMRVIPDAGMRVVALEAAAVDWLFDVPGADRARLAARDEIAFLPSVVSPGGSNCINTLAFNLDRTLFRDRRLRLAVAHAIDREAFVERIEFGGGRVPLGPISSRITIARAPGLAFPAYDTVAAGRLLDTVGWRRGRDGIRVARGVPGVEDGSRLAITFTHMPAMQPYGDLLRAQLRVVGIELELRALEPSVFVVALFTERSFDTGIISYCNGTDPEIGVRRMFVSSNILPVPFSNAAGYRNPVMDSLFDAARTTLDSSARRELYRHIQELGIRDLPYLSLVETETTRAYRTRCRDFHGGAHFAASARCDP